MENTEAKKLFDDQFKFGINTVVRHKGDDKGKMEVDMGLLVLRRALEENADDDGNVNYLRNYICRMIRYSGSGDLAQFKESELMTVEDYDQKMQEREEERNTRRNLSYARRDAIFNAFGVRSGTTVYLKTDGKTDKGSIYKVTGYKRANNENFLLLYLLTSDGRATDEAEVKSKDEFEIITEK